VRISPALAIDTGAAGRHWVGRAIAEVGDRGLHVPAWLREKRDRALAEVSNRVDAAGLLIREGILTHARCPWIPWSGRERISGDARARSDEAWRPTRGQRGFDLSATTSEREERRAAP
jgi:hypothetical protein